MLPGHYCINISDIIHHQECNFQTLIPPIVRMFYFYLENMFIQTNTLILMFWETVVVLGCWGSGVLGAGMSVDGRVT